MGYKLLTVEDVVNDKQQARVFAEYLSQQLGIPQATQKDINILGKKAKDIFQVYPNANWYTMCRIAQWCKARKRRPPRVWMVLDKFRDAWASGAVPELSYDYKAPDKDLVEQINDALLVEQRPEWRRLLMLAESDNSRKSVLSSWQENRVAATSSP